jgi:polyvinyl alcohol dehydrogenase (cytochrome)
VLRAARRLVAAAGVVVVLAGLPLSGAGAQASGDWPTYLNNPARTGYNSAETLITPSTAPNLTQRWTDRAGGAISAEPIEVNGVAYYGSWDGYEHAVDAATGTQLWSAYLGQTTDTNCAPPTVGVASTASAGTITVNGTATQAVFVGGGDGNFYALNAFTGAVIWKTSLGTPPDYFLWSSPLFYNGSIYQGIASFGDCPLIRGGIVQLDAATGTIQNTLYTVPAGCTGASVWGSPAVDTTTGGIYFGTGNAGSCSSGEPLAVAVVQTDSSLNLLSSWQIPSSQQPNKDSDFGSTPTLFDATKSGAVHQMVGLQNKNGIYYAFDRSAISSGPLWRKRMSVGGACPQCGKADISPSVYDGHHLFVGSENTTIGGVSCAGSIRELRPSTGKAVWADCLQSGPVLGAVTAVPGVAFVGAGNTVYGVSTSTGAILWSHVDTNNGSGFWGATAISNGQVYVGNQDGNLYAFGT